MPKIFFVLLLFPIAVFADTIAATSQVRSAEAIQWGYLNPLRGEASPLAADLWGDRKKDIATGMLVKFKKGFSSPPHIHNITYRGVVVAGLMHNDDPQAKPMWLPSGSFWTQPAGEDHITSANGEGNLIYLEIDSGPYLVRPSEEQFDNAEKPINLHASNLVWLNKDDVKMLDGTKAEMTNLWGSTRIGKLGGALVRFPAGFAGRIKANGKEFRAVVIEGRLAYSSVTTDGNVVFAPGSFFSSTNEFSHKVSTTKQSLIYVRTNGSYKVISN